MANNLRKLKLEFGGDYLHLAQAKCDDISDLERFRYRSEPTWMFVSDKLMVNLIFGANSPKILQQIVEELQKESEIREGIRERVGVPVTSLSPEEQEIYDLKQAAEEEARQIEEERVKQDFYDRQMAIAQVILQTVPKNGIILVFPQAKDMVKATLASLWEPAGLAISVTERPLLTEALIEELLYFTDFRFSEPDMADLLGSNCVAYFLKSKEYDDRDTDELVKRFVYGEMMEPPGSPDSPAQRLQGYIIIPKTPKSSIQLPSDIMFNKSPSIMSRSNVRSKNEIRSSNEVRSRNDIQSKNDIQSRSDIRSIVEMESSAMLHSREALDSAMESLSEVIHEDAIVISGLWAPPNSLVRALAVKVLFPKIYEPVAIPEPIPIPPHVMIAFDAINRRQVFDLMKNYSKDIVLQYGFFSSDNYEEAKLLAKTLNKFERIKEKSPTSRLLLQLSRVKSEPLCAFAQLNPTYISHNTVVGEKECLILFPEGYDEGMVEEEEVKEVQTKRRKSKKAKGKGKTAAQKEEEDEEETEKGEEEEKGDEKERIEEEELEEEEQDQVLLLTEFGPYQEVIPYEAVANVETPNVEAAKAEVTPPPLEEKPAPPVEKKPSPTQEEKLTPPVEKKSSPMQEEKPAPPEQEKQTQPAEEQPAPAVEETTAPPAEEAPAPAVEETPAVEEKRASQEVDKATSPTPAPE